MTSKLYQPLQIGAIKVANRMAMAPLTRCRSNAGHISDMMIKHYTDRATAGLLIVEAIAVTPNTVGFPGMPFITDDSFIPGLRKLTDSVHNAGGKIVLQLIHCGRAAPKEFNDGIAPVAPSPIPISHGYFSGYQMKMMPSDTPREITDAEALAVIDDFKKATARAMKAGFDGVEVHGANGYLINQFLCSTSNKRPNGSRYAGDTFESRARFALETVDACAAEAGADRVGIRLSPYTSYNDAKWADAEKDSLYIGGELAKREIAYVHVIRRDSKIVPNSDPTLDATTFFKKSFKHSKNGALLTNVEFEREEAEQYVDQGKADMIVFGTPFLANPDLVRRFKEKRDGERNVPDMNTFYGGGDHGYNDYPFLA